MREKEIDTWDGARAHGEVGRGVGYCSCMVGVHRNVCGRGVILGGKIGYQVVRLDHDGESDGVIASKEFGMIVGCDTEDAIDEGAAKIYNLITGADTEEASTAGDAGEFTLYSHGCHFLEVNTNDFASSDSSVKSSKPKPDDSTSCASTSSVSTSENEAEIESNVWTAIQEPIIVQDLPSFSCNSSDKNENTSRTSCNKNGYFNKKAGHFRKHASSVSKTDKVNIPPARPQPVPTGKPKGFAPVPTGRQNRPFPVPTDRGYSPSVISGWWKNGQLLLSPQQVVLGNHIEKDNHFPDAEDEGVFNSSCSRSMTGNKERLDDFQVIQGGKVMFEGGKGRITGKGTIRTLTLDFENVYYVKELQQFNLFSISQICDKKNRVLFTNTECLVLSKDFKLPDESMVVLRVPMKHNIYTINLNILCPREHKDETYPVLKDFVNLVENQLNKKVKAMRCDNVRTACYVLNRVLVTSPYNKTSYALLTGNIPSIRYFKPFGCHVTILNTSDHLGKFDGKADEGYIVGYSASNKAYMVYNVPNKRVEETMNLRFLEEKPNVQGLGQEWYFDLNYLTDTLGYKHVQANQSVGTQEATTNPAGTQDADSDSDCDEQVIIVPFYPSHSIQGTKPKDTSGDEVDDSPLHFADEIFQKELASLKDQEQRATSNAKSLGMGFANDAEELQKRASAKTVPPGRIPLPTGSIPVPSGDTRVSTDDVPLHTSSSTDSFFDDKPTTRFPSPSNLGNHDPSPGIFSFLFYDDKFGAALNNVASTVELCKREARSNRRLLVTLLLSVYLFACFLSQVKNPVFHQRTKHIKIRHHFIRDANEKKLIQVLKMHIDDNVVNLLTKAFDGPRDEHNKVGYLLKPTGSDDYHHIIDFLRASHIRSPELDDDGGIDDLPIAEIYSGIDNLGYVTEGKLTFFKNKFSPQWRFLVHTILHCLSTKSGSWDQFGSPLVVALICLSDGRQFNWSSYIFKEMVSNIGNAKKFLMLNFEGHPMPLLAAMLSQAQKGEGAGVAAQAVPQHMPAPDKPQDHLSTPPRQQPSDPNALVFEHGPFTNVEDEPLGGSFHMSPLRSTQAPPAGQTSGGAEDLITLTVLSSVVSTLVQKVNTLETELKDHKKLFKDVVGKLVKTVKAMEVKLRTMKMKMVMSDSDQEEGRKQDMDLDALLALANASVTVDSNISPDSASDNHAVSTSVLADVLTGALNVPTGSTSVPADVPIGVAPAGVSNKGKTLMVEEDIIVKEMTFKQMQEDILGEHDVKRQFVKNPSCVVYSTGWSMARVKFFTDDQLKEEFEKIQKAISNIQIQAFSRTLKRTGPVIEEPFSKRKKSIEAPIPSVPEVPQSPVVSSPKSSDEAPRLWSALVGWEVIPTPLGDINALYRIDRSTKHFTTLRQILHMVDRQDLVLFDSHEGDVSYPFLVNLMERMLRHKLEIDKDVMGNDMTTAEQLIQFIKNQLAAAKVSPA
nr:ribonuclease H-like domain-containing protein [Tanacetum cinerariifolium]